MCYDAKIEFLFRFSSLNLKKICEFEVFLFEKIICHGWNIFQFSEQYQNQYIDLRTFLFDWL